MITRIGNSKIFQSFIKKTSDKKYMEKINRNLPLIESLFATSCYFIATETNKKIPKERKVSLNLQTLLGGIAGVALSKMIDNFATKHKDSICRELEKINLPNSKNILKGSRILVPLLITSLATRYTTSILSTILSNKIADKKRRNKTLDKIA